MTDSHLNIEKLSALVEKQEVEGRKIREALITKFEKVTSNPEPILNKEGAETKHVQPKSKSTTKLHYCQYCSPECYHKANGSKRPDVFTLLEDFKELKSFIQVGKKYGVTDNAVRKWCKMYGILDKVKI